MMARTKKKGWSWSTGRRGRNRVRVFEHSSGLMMLEFRKRGRRERMSLGHRDRERAMDDAQRAVARLAAAEELKPEEPRVVTLGELFEQYLGEVTPEKSAAVQKFDQAAAERLKQCLGPGREVSKLSRREWDQFKRERRSGRYTGRRVGPRTVARDLKFLLAVLNWAAVSGDGRGGFLLDRNPLRGLPLPKEKSPRRPAMTAELRRGLMEHSPNWQFELAMLLERETRRRNASIRRLRWSDIDFHRDTVRWRAEFDKAGRGRVTPLSPEAVGALKKAPSRSVREGPVFPSARDASKPTPRGTFQVWLRRAKAGWLKATPEGDRPMLREQLRGVGFHSEKRAGVRDPRFRALPPAIQQAWAGTSYQVLKDVYDDVTAEDIRTAIEQQERVVGSR